MQQRRSLNHKRESRPGDCRLRRGDPAPIPDIQRPAAGGDLRGSARRNTSWRLPTAARPSGSIRVMLSGTAYGAEPGSARRSTSRSSPTATRPSGSIRILLSPTATGVQSAWQEGVRSRSFADCNQAIRLNPAVEGGYCTRGYAWLCKKEYDQAITDLTEAIRLDPSDAQAYSNRGWACGKAGIRSGEERLQRIRPAQSRRSPLTAQARSSVPDSSGGAKRYQFNFRCIKRTDTNNQTA